ncbi:histidine phosphatase family protein [Adhaeribacter radiodurans]|uniref:Histidine phosphatase family protein n=1 Tax=Adhaeribacter radiodurans TaxID=2745197 RepID=A0A7L7LE72_9BACT|nr:histidine phosphatase family protein [Adhaeribacter radiodurans]QMU31110.1 histidine phosphatase family protein [Adhaeribacter radiodurans]
MAEAKLLHIFLIRHQRPVVSKQGWFNREQASQFLMEYDACAIEELVTKPAGLPTEQITKVYCSSLPRAKQTAQAIFGPEITLIEDPIFNEFQRQAFSIPYLKFPIKFWLIGARALWLLGINTNGLENFRQARIRAHKAAQQLVKQAERDGKVVLVAHGFLNIFIRRALRKMGWHIVRYDGGGFLGVSELVKKAEK